MLGKTWPPDPAGLGLEPSGTSREAFGTACVSFYICKMGPRTRTRAPAAARDPGRRRPGCARAAEDWRGGGTGSGGRVPGASARGRTHASRARWRGRGGAAHVASRKARRRLLQPSLVELAPPWRARPLHKRPPRRRWRTPTWSDPPRAEEGAQRCRHSPPRLRRKSSPPSLPLLPPLTGNFLISFKSFFLLYREGSGIKTNSRLCLPPYPVK